jgi:hypothetical protein
MVLSQDSFKGIVEKNHKYKNNFLGSVTRNCDISSSKFTLSTYIPTLASDSSSNFPILVVEFTSLITP